MALFVAPIPIATAQFVEIKPPIIDETYIKSRIEHYADSYGVSREVMSKVIECENRVLDPKLQSYHKDPRGPNGREDSWGLVQIHLPSHNVTREQAQDVEYSLRFLAEKLKNGEGKLWTCYRIIYAS